MKCIHMDPERLTAECNILKNSTLAWDYQIRIYFGSSDETYLLLSD